MNRNPAILESGLDLITLIIEAKSDMFEAEANMTKAEANMIEAKKKLDQNKKMLLEAIKAVEQSKELGSM